MTRNSGRNKGKNRSKAAAQPDPSENLKKDDKKQQKGAGKGAESTLVEVSNHNQTIDENEKPVKPVQNGDHAGVDYPKPEAANAEKVSDVIVGKPSEDEPKMRHEEDANLPALVSEQSVSKRTNGEDLVGEVQIAAGLENGNSANSQFAIEDANDLPIVKGQADPMEVAGGKHNDELKLTEENSMQPAQISEEAHQAGIGDDSSLTEVSNHHQQTNEGVHSVVIESGASTAESVPDTEENNFDEEPKLITFDESSVQSPPVQFSEPSDEPVRTQDEQVIRPANDQDPAVEARFGTGWDQSINQQDLVGEVEFAAGSGQSVEDRNLATSQVAFEEAANDVKIVELKADLMEVVVAADSEPTRIEPKLVEVTQERPHAFEPENEPSTTVVQNSTVEPSMKLPTFIDTRPAHLEHGSKLAEVTVGTRTHGPAIVTELAKAQQRGSHRKSATERHSKLAEEGDAGRGRSNKRKHALNAEDQSLITQHEFEDNFDPLPGDNNIQESKDQQSKESFVRLQNLGATCYLNSALQAILPVKPLHKILLGNDCHDKPLSRALFELFKFSYGGRRRGVAFNTKPVKSVIASIDDAFCPDHVQHDSREVLNLLLDNLHDEMNEIVNKPGYEQVKIEHGESCNSASEKFWKYYVDRNLSEIARLFYFQEIIFRKCSNCQTVSAKSSVFQPGHCIFLMAPEKGAQHHLSELLRQHFAEVPLHNKLGQPCYRCGQGKINLESQTIRHAPAYLTIQLKRFKKDAFDNFLSKTNSLIAYPEMLEIQDYEGDTHQYRLLSVVNHSGSMTSGHYWAYSRRSEGWFEFNDSRIEKLSSAEDHFSTNRNAYYFVYERVGKAELDEASKAVIRAWQTATFEPVTPFAVSAQKPEARADKSADIVGRDLISPNEKLSDNANRSRHEAELPSPKSKAAAEAPNDQVAIDIDDAVDCSLDMPLIPDANEDEENKLEKVSAFSVCIKFVYLLFRFVCDFFRFLKG